MSKVSKVDIWLTTKKHEALNRGEVVICPCECEGDDTLDKVQVKQINGEVKIVVNVGKSSMLDYPYCIVVPDKDMSISEAQYNKNKFTANNTNHFIKQLSNQDGTNTTLKEQIEKGVERRLEYEEVSNNKAKEVLMSMVESGHLKIGLKISDNCKGLQVSSTLEIGTIYHLTK